MASKTASRRRNPKARPAARPPTLTKAQLGQTHEVLEQMQSVQRLLAGPAIDTATAVRLQATLRSLATMLPAPEPVRATPPGAFILAPARPSGPEWVAEFPGSASPTDCVEPFRSALKMFLKALAEAGAKATIASTFRPPQRAYLMHWCWKISKNLVDPKDVPLREDVPIQWVHVDAAGKPDAAASRAAAQEMADKYRIVTQTYAPALKSRHTEGLAVDMAISWAGTLTIADKDGTKRSIGGEPRDGMNPSLHACGKTYGVVKATFEGDPPHWSSDGH